MSVRLDLSIVNPRLSTHEALVLDCSLQSDEVASQTIPSPYDRSGSFQIGLFGEDEIPLRVMDRQSRQFMMAEGRVDASLDLDTLEPGQAWTWDMNLASYHYAIPPGDFNIRAVYVYQPERIHAEWGPRGIHVAEDPLEHVQVLRDNPIIDGLTLLMQARGPDGPNYFLRLHNYQRPFGAWWSSRILQGEQADSPFCASANFYQTHSSEPFHQKWVLWTTSGGWLKARCFDRGQPTGLDRQARLPEGCRLLRSAIRTSVDDLYVFFLRGCTLEGYRLEHNRLLPSFVHELPLIPALDPAICGDESAIQIASPWRGILLDRLGYEGTLLSRQHVFQTRLRPFSITCEPGEQRIKALFVDGTHIRNMRAVVVNLENNAVAHSSFELSLRSECNELHFDQDSLGRFHLLASTTNGRLYYYAEGRGPVLLAEGEERFFPVMVAPLKVYAGIYRRKYGYRFVQYQRRRHGSKIVGLEAHP